MTSSPSRVPLIAGNWKMFKTTGETRDFLATLHTSLSGFPNANQLPQIALFPPFTALSTAMQVVDELGASQQIRIGAQNMESRENGAFTGEVSARMLTDLSVPLILVGHSERRQYYSETDESVNQKTQAALRHNLTPVVCVGETLEQRESGQTDEVIKTQVITAVQGLAPTDFPLIVLAYEPVWAIGTGKVCEADEANRVCALIRQTLNTQANADNTRVLYGGSVKPDNIEELMKKPDIDGALVGGASLDPASFYQLIEKTAQTVHATVPA
ncbi:MAG: triose-phosphate isomerase [Vampirovibrio sp.]|nr:triose-phosphate isomerase [Vampirovibrio sp.]